MTFRPFVYEQDLEPVLQLFQNGLSRTGDRQWFNWKHRQNPFGHSPGFLAELDGSIVAARFFLRWQFRNLERVVRAVRPVDTVVHPSARRRGVFTKLTLYGLEHIAPEEQELIFNTPNNNSLPGYLKMGWRKYRSPLPYCYRPTLPLTLSDKVTVGSTIPTDVPSCVHFTDRLATDLSEDFIKWRYASGTYRYASFDDGRPALLIYRLLRVKRLPVLSISDYVGDPQFQRTLALSAAARERCLFIHVLADDPAWPSGDRGLRVRSGSSLVAIRGGNTITPTGFRFSPGDLEDVL